MPIQSAQILLVEDDPALGRGLQVSLELEGYKVHWAQSLQSAKEIFKIETIGFVLLDIGLPDGNGLSFLKEIREAGSNLPVVILTALSDELSVVQGLEAGANDYVRKPFGKLELLARVQAALRAPETKATQMQCEGITVLLDQRRVMNGDVEVEMKRREFDVLTFLVRNFNSVVTRSALVEAFGKDGEIFDRTIDSHVSHLRARLKQASVTSVKINSIYGIGYRLEKA